MEITEVMAERGHEQVVLVADAATRLRAVIAVHSTALGPSLGGVRFWHYAHESDALTDVLLRLTQHGDPGGLELSMPRWTFRTPSDLKVPLMRLGMVDAFSDIASDSRSTSVSASDSCA